MSILLCASITTIVTMLLVHLALSSRDRPLESLQFAELSATIDLGDFIINERQPDESLDWAYSTLSESAKFDANLSPFELGALTWEPIVVSTCSNRAVSHVTCPIEPFILELEALAISQLVPCSETEKLHRLVEFYPLPPPLEYSFDRSMSEEDVSSDETDEIDDPSTGAGREGPSDMSHSHLSISDTEHLLDGLDDVPTLNLELAENAVDCRFEEYDMLSNVEDDSEGSVYSDYNPEDSIYSDYEEQDMPSNVEDDSEGSIYSEYEPEDSVHSNCEEPVEFDTPLPEGPILPSVLQPLDTHSSSPHCSASLEIQRDPCATYPVHRTPFDSEPPVLAPPQNRISSPPPFVDNFPEKLHFYGTYPEYRTPFDPEPPVMAPPAPVSRGQKAFLEASKEFAAKISNGNHDLYLGEAEPNDDSPEDTTFIYHDCDSEDCQIPLQPNQCESRQPTVIPPPIPLASIFAGRTEKICFNKPEPLLDYRLIRPQIPDYVPPNCEARIQKIYDTLAPLPKQCKPVDGSHKSNKLFVHQSQDAISNYTEYMEQCVIQLRAVKREMKKLEALETQFMPEHRKIGKEIIQSIDSGIEDISKEYFSSHKDLVSDVNIISQRRHIPTRFLARVVSKSWRGVANDVAFNVAIFLEERETRALMLLSKVSKLMRDSENYAHNLALEKLLFHRRHYKRFDEMERARLSRQMRPETDHC